MFFVEDCNIDFIGQILLPLNLRPVPGTMKIHQVISHTDVPQIHYRQLSCFCGIISNKDNKICQCFSPKIHYYQEATSTKNQNLKENDSQNQCSENEGKMKKKLVNNDTIINNGCSDTLVEVNENDIMKDGWRMDSVITETEQADIYKWMKEWNNNIVLEDKDMNTSVNLEEYHVETFDLTKECRDTTIARDTDQDEIFVLTKECSDCKFVKEKDQNEWFKTPVKKENDRLKRRLPPKIYDSKRQLKKGEDSKENIVCKQNPSIRTAISRVLQCFTCKIKLPFTSRDLIKCMACKNMYCIVCTDGQTYSDYICRHCFGED